MRPPGRFDWGSPLLLLIALVFGGLVFVQPTELVTDLTWGDFFIPFAGDGRWLTPVGAVAIVAFLLFLVRSATASRPLMDLAGWVRSSREADLRGALYLAVALGGVILAFATADPPGAGLLRPRALVPPRRRGRRRRPSPCTSAAPRHRSSPAVRCGRCRPGARSWSRSSSAPP